MFHIKNKVCDKKEEKYWSSFLILSNSHSNSLDNLNKPSFFFISWTSLTFSFQSKLLTFIKFVSAILDHSCASQCFHSIFDAAPSGSFFLIMDNSQPQLKKYVENLIFPANDYKQNGNHYFPLDFILQN